MRILCVLALVPAVVLGQPAITGVTGTIDSGETLTVAVTGHGAKSQAGPEIFFDYETASADGSGYVEVGTGTDWIPMQGVREPPLLTQDWSHSGSYAGGSKASEYPGEGGDWTALEYQLSTGGSDKAYLSMWVYVKDLVDDDSAGGYESVLKAPRMTYSTAYNDSYTGCFNFGSNTAIDVGKNGSAFTINADRRYNPGAASGSTVLYDHNTIFNQPFRLEMYVEISTAGVANGAYYSASFNETYQDFDNNTSLTTRLSGETFDIRYVRAFYGISNYVGGETRYTDDIYIDTTPQRIEIGNNSDFFSCTYREIQVPDAWGASSVQFNLRYFDAVSESETLYIFVVDEDNVPSTGYAVDW